MGVTYTIEAGVLRMELAGVYPATEVPARFLEALADPACPRPVALLVDVTRSQSLATRPASDIRMISEFLGPHAARIGGRCAVVAATDVQFGLGQMGAVHSGRVGVTARVFRSADEALAWLRAPTGESE